MGFTIQKMTAERALMILTDLVEYLSEIDPEEMTTFELNILHRCAENPPKQRYGKEVDYVG